jgi:hypothetical protein
MKIINKLLFVGLLMLPLIPSDAQTDSDREFKQIQADREKAIKDTTEPITQRYQQDLQAAIEPINLRCQASLEKLLDRATREADFDLALKVKTVLNTLPQVVAKQLAGTWALRTDIGYTATITFQSSGTCTNSEFGNFRWRIEGTTLYIGPTNTGDRLQLPIVEGKLKGTNKFGNELILTRK